jgi:CBS domain-containing protein
MPSVETTVVADLMLRKPKTLPADATVADARAQLASGRAKMLLLVEGSEFRGALTSIPPDADDDAPAITFADDDTETIAPDASGDDVIAQLNATAHGRIVVLDEQRNLHGLLCLSGDGSRLCAR